MDNVGILYILKNKTKNKLHVSTESVRCDCTLI